MSKSPCHKPWNTCLRHSDPQTNSQTCAMLAPHTHSGCVGTFCLSHTLTDMLSSRLASTSQLSCSLHTISNLSMCTSWTVCQRPTFRKWKEEHEKSYILMGGCSAVEVCPTECLWLAAGRTGKELCLTMCICSSVAISMGTCTCTTASA